MRNKQAGGIVTFVIVGIALVGLLGGGLYLSKHQARVARDNDTSQPVAAPSRTERETPRDETANNSGTAGTSTNKPTASQPAAPQTGGSTQGSSTDRVASTGPSSVPETGPTETGAVMVALAVVVFSLFKVGQARRGMVSAALRR